MNSTEIPIFFEEQKAAALKMALEQEGTSLEQKLQGYLEILYEQLVPTEQQFMIEAQLQMQGEREHQMQEMGKRFALYHVQENGMDFFFTNQQFLSFYAASYRYRLYARRELNADVQTLADAFWGSERISAERFHVLKEQMLEDFRIQALMEFDLDKGNISVCSCGCREMQCYDLYDISAAAYRASRGGYRGSGEREKIFHAFLAGKKINGGRMDMEAGENIREKQVQPLQ